MIPFDPLSVVQFIVLLVLLIGGFEFVLRLKGKSPDKGKVERSRITPEDKFYGEHPVLGFIHQPGIYTLNINNRFDFTAKHGPDGFRITGNDSTELNEADGRPQIWILGCSYTYGWLVNDHETYPWLVQKNLPKYKIKNLGVNGYGTLQSYLQFKETVKTKPAPAVAILGYSDFHQKRDTVERRWKKEHAYVDRVGSFVIPAARIDNESDDLTILYDSMDYRGFPLTSKSALMTVLENRYNIYRDEKLGSWEVAEKVLEKFQTLALKMETTFVLAGINDNDATMKMLRICQNKGMRTVDISVDRSKNHPEHTHYPYDSHPSPLAHQKYAEKLTRYLTEQKLAHSEVL